MTKATVSVVSFNEALDIVLGHAANLATPATEVDSLLACVNRVLAEVVCADRDQPPFDRSTRDGFAVRAADFGSGELRIAGKVRAGEQWQGGALEQGAALEIMTGAPVPECADAVVMVEHVERAEGGIRPLGERTVQSGENIVRRGSEARAGEAVLPVGTLIEGAEIALAAACGCGSGRACRPVPRSGLQDGSLAASRRALRDRAAWAGRSGSRRPGAAGHLAAGRQIASSHPPVRP